MELENALPCLVFADPVTYTLNSSTHQLIFINITLSCVHSLQLVAVWLHWIA